MKLYTYFRSSSSYRVRIALNLKRVDYEAAFIHLRKGDQFGADYVKVNPQQQVPTLITDDGDALVQSPAILEWIDETWPDPPLLPGDPLGRQRVRAIAALIGCDIHPIDNLRVLKYVTEELGATQDQLQAWFNHWVELGFDALEKMLDGDPETGRYCHGDSPTLADVYLAPQVFNSQRFKLPLDPYPNIKRIYDNCMALDAFHEASPPEQPDWENPT